MPHTERLYYEDSFLQDFAARVTKSRELPGPSAEFPVWQLALDRSAFYPTSGGQPFDTGLLRIAANTSSPINTPVEQVEEDDEGTVWHFVRSSIPEGTEIRGQIDWPRRLDHMQQHTGQHLLSAVFVRELHAPTVSFHLGETISTIDLATSSLAHHSVERVERIANELIGEDRPVTVSYASRAEAEAMLISGELRKLPDREGTIRMIEISNLDRNACGGTHVRSTGQIGGLLIRGIEKVSRGVRVEFVCGLRAVCAARSDFSILTEASGLLSAGTPELPALIKQMLADSKAAAKERQKLREELATHQAAEIARNVPVENGLRFVAKRWRDRDRDFVKLLASRVASAAPLTVAYFCCEDADPLRVFLSRSQDLKFNSGQIMKEALASLGLRGGGSPDLAQGEVARDQELALQARVTDAIRRSLAEAKENS